MNRVQRFTAFSKIAFYNKAQHSKIVQIISKYLTHEKPKVVTSEGFRVPNYMNERIESQIGKRLPQNTMNVYINDMNFIL